MNKITKCKACGKYEIKYKTKKHKKEQFNLFPELNSKLQQVSEWKWCIVKNNWCRYVANHCDYVSIKKQQQLKKENKLLQEIKEE